MNKSIVLALSFAMLVLCLQVAGAQEKILSPSVDKPREGRLQNTGDNPNAIDPSLLTGGAQPDVEPTRALLSALETMIPRQVTGTDLESPLLEASQLFLDRKFSQTLELLQKLAADHADMPPPPLLVAGMWFTAGNATQGRAWLEKASREFPDYPTIYSGFARLAITEQRVTDAAVLLEKAQRTMQDRNWNEKQLQLFQIEYLDALADVAILRGQFENARQHTLELQKNRPDNARITLRLAQIEFDLDNIESSVEYLKQTRKMSPNLRRPEVIIADWLMRKGRNEDSEKWIAEAATQYPEDAAVQMDYGKWLLRNDRLPQALKAIETAEQLGAPANEVAFWKGQAHFARRAYDAAQIHFQNLNQQRPGDGDVANMLALSLIESDDPAKQQKALELATMNQRLFPRSPTAMATLGWIYYRLGRVTESEQAFKQIASTTNLEPAAAYFVATYLSERDNIQPAIALLNGAMQSGSYFMYRSVARELLTQLETRLAEQTDRAAQPDADKDPDSAGDDKTREDKSNSNAGDGL